MTDESTSHRCRVCGRSFPTERLLVLHRGVRHPGELADEELAAYREAYADEQSRLRSFRLRALGVLVLLYFGFLFLFALFAS
jgi:predicted nucleic acid-binding Zn ribbon protein